MWKSGFCWLHVLYNYPHGGHILAFVTSQWVGYELPDPLHCIADFCFFRIFFPSYLIDTLFNSITPFIFRSFFFISSTVHKESSLLLTTPFLTFRDLWGTFWHRYCQTFVVFSRKSILPRQAEFYIFIVIGVRFVDITFSIMKGDKLVIGALLDSMIMNLGEGASVSLSEESDSFKLRLNFLFEKEAVSVIYFLLVLCSTTHHGVQLEKGMNQEGN